MHGDHGGGPEPAYYVLDGEPVQLDPERGPLTARGERVDCVAWMNRAVSVSHDEYLVRAAARLRPSGIEPI